MTTITQEAWIAPNGVIVPYQKERIDIHTANREAGRCWIEINYFKKTVKVILCSIHNYGHIIYKKKGDHPINEFDRKAAIDPIIDEIYKYYTPLTKSEYFELCRDALAFTTDRELLTDEYVQRFVDNMKSLFK